MALEGRFAELPLPDLIQSLSTNMKTCRVYIRGREADGALYVEQGQIVHAQFGHLFGDEAVYAFMADSDQARFLVQSDIRTAKRTVRATTIGLLLEASRRIDEGLVSSPAAPSQSQPGVAAPPFEAAPSRGPTLAQFLGIGLVLFTVGAIGGYLWYSTGAPKSAIVRSAPVDAAQLTGPNDRKPHLLRGRPPVAPNTGDGALLPSIVCRILVQPDGTVSEARVYRPRPDLWAFESVALAAVERYAFQPALRSGTPTAVWVNWPVTFESTPSDAAVRLRVKGSDTIGGVLGPALATSYQGLHEDVSIAIDALGSSTGFAALFDGTADLAASSRPIQPAEVQEASRLGIQLKEHVIGYDGIAVVVHPDNRLTSVSMEQLRQLFSGEVDNWAALGGDRGEVEIVSRPSYSGTHGFFRDRVLRREGGRATFSSSAKYFEKNEDIIEFVSGHPHALAFLGTGWTRHDGIKVLPVSSTGSAIAPREHAIRDGSYPISRPLLMYTRGRPKGHLAGFLRFILSSEGQAFVSRQGFVTTEADVDALIDPALVDQPMPTYEPLVFRVYFSPRQRTVDEAAAATLQAIARRLQTGAYRASIVGHSDTSGTRRENQIVSRARAESVKAALIERGVAPAALDARSASTSQPRQSNRTRGGRRENRRVDVTLSAR